MQEKNKGMIFLPEYMSTLNTIRKNSVCARGSNMKPPASSTENIPRYAPSHMFGETKHQRVRQSPVPIQIKPWWLLSKVVRVAWINGLNSPGTFMRITEPSFEKILSTLCLLPSWRIRITPGNPPEPITEILNSVKRHSYFDIFAWAITLHRLKIHADRFESSSMELLNSVRNTSRPHPPPPSAGIDADKRIHSGALRISCMSRCGNSMENPSSVINTLFDRYG